MTGIWRRRLFGGTAGLALAVMATLASGREPEPPDVKVALLVDGACGPFADSLPAVITESEVASGGTVADVTICVLSSGGDGRSLALRAVELVDVDPACTGEEASVDATCGHGGVGELSDALIQQVGVGSCRQTPRIDRTGARSLSELSTNSLLLAPRLQEDRVRCIRLVLRYEADPPAVMASQSDRATWRYSLTLSGEGQQD